MSPSTANLDAMKWYGLLVASLLGAHGCGSEGSSSATGASDDAATSSVVPAALDAGMPVDALCTACGACEQKLVITSSKHVEGNLSYEDPPPAGGAHNQCWADWGVHTDPVADQRWVHNLEHGGIVFLYQCPEGCDDEVAQMAAFVKDKKQALLTPYAQLSTRFAVVAWGYRLVSDCFDAATFEAFYARHLDKAPESLASYPPKGCHVESD